MTREFGWKIFRGMDASACPSVKYSNSCHFIHPSLSLSPSVWYRYIFLLIFILFSICSTSNLLLATQTRLQTKVTRLPTIILQYVKHTSFKIDIRKVNTREWRLGSEFIIVRLVFIHHFASISVAFMYNIARQFYKEKATSHICPFEYLSVAFTVAQYRHSSTLVPSMESPHSIFHFHLRGLLSHFLRCTQDLTGY